MTRESPSPQLFIQFFKIINKYNMYTPLFNKKYDPVESKIVLHSFIYIFFPKTVTWWLKHKVLLQQLGVCKYTLLLSFQKKEFQKLERQSASYANLNVEEILNYSVLIMKFRRKQKVRKVSNETGHLRIKFLNSNK